MTDHKLLKMCHEDRRITDKEIVKMLLGQNNVCTVCIPDEPYPYVVPMNYGYEWEENLILYLHMASEGHRAELLRRTNLVSCNIHLFLDRYRKKRYRGENHDYRSVTVYGRAEMIGPDQPEEFLKGLNLLGKNCGRAALKKVPKSKNLLVLKITAEIVTAKAQYPLEDARDAFMPPLNYGAEEEKR